MRLIDRYFYKPLWWQKILIFLLLPISYFYCLCAYLKRKLSTKLDFGIPIISVGNLVVGGSGKTPFIIQIANAFPDRKIAIISRGYKRKSKGLVIVSNQGTIQCSPQESGDEPYLIAQSVKHATVIVCKNRKQAILQAKEMRNEIVFLDDGFRFNFKKLNIVLKPKLQPYYPFCLPSGMYREWKHLDQEADLVIQEGEDYVREVSVKNATKRMLLVTAIASPSRLEEFLPDVVGKIYYPDHATFQTKELQEKIQQYNATSLLITSKDYVKLKDTGFELSLLELQLRIKDSVLQTIATYIQGELSNESPTL
ncbi:tetraacyldisaccharide 4'-kinase [Helicobacter enhydrae]|uniref:Tetraacyldisaccharide 4'-kinase n=1 Tax=Helicobacter enhydrae TaxID=222136 RepID=A0A1B1U4P7_9HELI|nr:tetraacyldisaccharide 4'-kinase [Helicobacter enhydrae]ANV97743.1 tetraacyldisaccharide 4'-kinase [Helicobacter enhydrae]